MLLSRAPRARRRGASRRRRAADFFAAKGVLGGRARRAAGGVDGRAAPSRAVPAPGPRRARARRRRAASAGSASCTRRRRGVGPRARPPRVRARPRRASRRAARSRVRATSPPSRRCARTSPSSCPRSWPRRRSSPPCARAGGPCSPRAEVFDVYRGAAGRRGRRLARAAARVPRARPHAHRRGGRAAARARSRRARRRSSGGGSVPSVVVVGASGYAGALAARAAAPPPALRADGAHRALGRRARGSTSSTRTTGCRSMLEELDLDRHAERRRRDRRLPARRGRAARRRAARAGRARRRPVAPTSACATPSIYERLVRRAPGARAARARPSTACQSCYRERSRAPTLVANPGCFPTAALLGLAPLARAGLIDDVVIDAKTRRLRRRPRRDRRRPTSSPSTRTSSPTESAATATRRRSTRSWPRSARRVRPTFIAAPGAARPGRADLLLRDADAELADDARRALRGRLRRASRSSSWPTRPPGVRDVRETNICRISVHADERTGRALVFAAIDNLWKGTVLAGGAEPQPDVRPRREAGGIA